MLTACVRLPRCCDGDPCTVQQQGSLSGAVEDSYRPQRRMSSHDRAQKIDSVIRARGPSTSRARSRARRSRSGFGLSKSDIETLRAAHRHGATTAGKLSEIHGAHRRAPSPQRDRPPGAGGAFAAGAPTQAIAGGCQARSARRRWRRSSRPSTGGRASAEEIGARHGRKSP